MGRKMEKCWIIYFLSGNSRPKERKQRNRVGKETTTKSNHESLRDALTPFIVHVIARDLKDSFRTCVKRTSPSSLRGWQGKV